jgi:predicted Fe-Mo cluster-binding NifX family protein
MRIAVASMGSGGLEDTVSPLFGISPSFTLIEAEDQEILGTEIVANKVAGVLGTAGAESARDLIKRGVDVVIAGDFGPEAVDVFSSMGIDMYRLSGMSVADAAKQFLNRAADTVRGEGRGAVPTEYETRTYGGGVALGERRRSWGWR